MNWLNSRGAGPLPLPPVPSLLPPPFIDVNGDNIASPADALIVINGINSFGAGEGEDDAASPREAIVHPLRSRPTTSAGDPPLRRPSRLTPETAPRVREWNTRPSELGRQSPENGDRHIARDIVFKRWQDTDLIADLDELFDDAVLAGDVDAKRFPLPNRG